MHHHPLSRIRWLAAALVAVLAAAAPAGAQVSPQDVYVACRHPDAEIAGMPLHTLCLGFQIPPTGARFSSSHLRQWVTAAVPTGARIREYRDSVKGKLDIVPLLERDLGVRPVLRFNKGEAMLDTLQQGLMARLAPVLERQLARDRNVRVIVQGWADSPDSEAPAANEALAEQRALAVKEELILNGIPASRIGIMGPELRSETTEAGRRATRGARIMLEAPRIITSTAVHAAAGVRPVRVAGADAALAPIASPAAARAWSLSMSSLATGATDVLLDRASEQVQVYVIGAASRRLCTTAAGVLKPGSGHRTVVEYLPQTCAFFGQDRAWQQIGGVGSLRSAFEQDVRAMPQRFAFQGLSWRVSDPAHNGGFVDVGQTAMFIMHVVEKLDRGQDPLAVFARLSRDRTNQLTLGSLTHHYRRRDAARALPLTEAFQRFTRLAAEVHDARETLAEFSANDAIPADTAMVYALRALLVAHRDTGQAQCVEVNRLLGAKLENVERLLAAHRSVEHTVAELQRVAARLDSAQAGTASWQELRRDLQARYFAGLTDIAIAAVAADPSQVATLETLAAPTRQINTGVRTGRYSEALHGVMGLMRHASTYFPKHRNQNGPFAHYEGEADVFRAMTLAVNVSEARSQDEVNAALRGFVGQARDYISKRETAGWHVSLNAYVGAAGGWEWVQRDRLGRGQEWDRGGVMSLHLPIGPEIGRNCGRGFSCGAFFPLIDLGAVASARFDDRETETFPEADLPRLFTPGAYFVAGIPRVPISVGVGFTYAPASRKLTEDAAVADPRADELNAFRFGVFAGVDIPLFP